MNLRRLLPPLVLLGVLGVIVWRAAQQPRREETEQRIRARWEDPSAWDQLQREIDRYHEQYHEPADLLFASRAYLRVRRPGEAVLARWPDLKRAQVPTLPREEVRAFAEEALLNLGWEDEERARRSPVYVQAVLALLEGENAIAREDLLGRFRREDASQIMVMMRRGMALPDAAGRALLSTTCRERAELERAAGRSSVDWDVAAAILAPKDGPYPGRDDDLRVLVGVVTGTWRVGQHGRWALACRALGESGDPQALEALRTVEATLDASSGEQDRNDLAIVRLGLLAAGQWDVEDHLKEAAQRPGGNMGGPRELYLEALLMRWRRGDARARARLDALWDGLGAEDPSVRERLARNQLLGSKMPGPEVPADAMLQFLELPGTRPALAVLAKAFRLRRGEPGAREALLLWMASKEGEDRTPGGNDPERALSPPISALRALYLY